MEPTAGYKALQEILHVCCRNNPSKAAVTSVQSGILSAGGADTECVRRYMCLTSSSKRFNSQGRETWNLFCKCSGGVTKQKWISKEKTSKFLWSILSETANLRKPFNDLVFLNKDVNSINRVKAAKISGTVLRSPPCLPVSYVRHTFFQGFAPPLGCKIYY